MPAHTLPGTRRIAAGPLLVFALSLTASGCGGRSDSVVVRASDEEGDPLAGLTVTAYPYDPDQLLDSLGAAAPTPRPRFPDLWRQLEAYRPPEDGPIRELSQPWRALRDSVARLADSLNAADRRAPAYAAAYDRFRTMYTRLAQRAAERDAALRALGGDDVALARRAQAAAESLRTWEYQAYAAYPEIAEARVAADGRALRDGTTDAHGHVTFDLEPGRWWLVARSPNSDNPFEEYYWNRPVTVTALLPVRVPLTTRNARVRWRY